jgi:hypothetical protein
VDRCHDRKDRKAECVVWNAAPARASAAWRERLCNPTPLMRSRFARRPRSQPAGGLSWVFGLGLAAALTTLLSVLWIASRGDKPQTHSMRLSRSSWNGPIKTDSPVLRAANDACSIAKRFLPAVDPASLSGPARDWLRVADQAFSSCCMSNQTSFFQCGDGRQVPCSAFADGFCDCTDGEDEVGTASCPSNAKTPVFMCPTGVRDSRLLPILSQHDRKRFPRVASPDTESSGLLRSQLKQGVLPTSVLADGVCDCADCEDE